MLYPQNGDPVVTVDSLTSYHPVYISLAAEFSHALDTGVPNRSDRVKKGLSFVSGIHSWRLTRIKN